MSKVAEWVLRRKAEVDAGLHQKNKVQITVRLCEQHVKVLGELAKRAGISKTKVATKMLEVSIGDCLASIQEHEDAA